MRRIESEKRTYSASRAGASGLRQQEGNDPVLKRLIVAFTISLVFGLSSASADIPQKKGTTVNGHLACFTENWYYEFTGYAKDGNERKIKEYIDAKRCTVLRGGLTVTITDPPGLFGATAGFTFYGVKLWTDAFGVDF